MIKKSLLKIVCLLIIVGLNWTGFLVVGRTSAFFSNNEDSNTNTFTASTLSFSLSSPEDFSPEITPTQNSSRTINLNNDGSLDFQYEAKVENATGTLCDYLNLKDDLSGVFQPLTNFVSATTTFSDKPNWLFTTELIGDDEGLQNQTCEFDFVFHGRQTNLPDSNQGFSDEERIENVIESGKWTISEGDVVINELMWMGSYKEPKDEWIELRNMTDSPIDIGGWQLTKLSGKKEKLMLEIPSEKTIPAAGFFLISNFDKDKSAINVEPDLVNKKVALRNKNLQVKLYKGDWKNSDNLIDTADDGKGKPLAGFHGKFFHFSMERNNIPGDGTQKENWHICFDDSQEMRNYWDSKIIHNKSVNRGTPGGKNLSDYDEAELIGYYQQLETEWLSEGLFMPDPISEKENYDEEELSLEEEPFVEEGSIEEIPITEEEPIEEEVITEENQEQGGIMEEINEIIDKVINKTVDKLMPDEETGCEVVPEPEVPVIDGARVIEEAPAEETPVIEEQPVAVPDDSSSIQNRTGEGSGDGSSEGDGDLVDESSLEDGGESPADSGDAEDIISEQ